MYADPKKIPPRPDRDKPPKEPFRYRVGDWIKAHPVVFSLAWLFFFSWRCSVAAMAWHWFTALLWLGVVILHIASIGALGWNEQAEYFCRTFRLNRPRNWWD